MADFDLPKYTKELSKLISGAENILLAAHLNPDGDAIGSQLAFYQFLKASGKNISMLSPNYIQEFLKWMPDIEKVCIYIEDRKKCRKIINNSDLIIMLDFNQSNRLGEAEDTVLKAVAKKVIIDHHLDSPAYSDLIISDPSKSSTSELVFKLITALNGAPFRNKAFAESIYVGIITDTGNFEHGSYDSDTFNIMSELFEYGIDKDRILNLIYHNFSAKRMQLMGFALNERMTVLPELRTAYICLSRDDLNLYSHVRGDTEGFVNLPLSINGIFFSALLIEKEGFVKVSFRSKGRFPTNIIASEYFSGGGHLNASGGEFQGTLKESVDRFLFAIKENQWRFEG